MLAQRVDHRLTLSTVLLHVAVHHTERREPDRVLALSRELMALAEPLGFPMFAGAGRFFHGCARADSGEIEQGIAAMEQALTELALTELAQTGTGIGAPGFLTVFADRLRKAGRHDEALGVVGLSLARAESQEALWVDAEFHRLHAQILLDRGDGSEEAEARLVRSLEIARAQENRLFRAALRGGAGEALAAAGQARGGRDLLAPVYAWFTEGFDLQDLRDAKALLDDLA